MRHNIETSDGASVQRRDRNKVLSVVGIIAGPLLLVGTLILETAKPWGHEAAAERSLSASEPGMEAPPIPPAKPSRDKFENKKWVEHTVIPAETLEEIALRYDVPIQSVQLWNGVDESAPLRPGSILNIKTTKDPLPWQQIIYRPDKRESWSTLAQRFDVPVSKLQAYNPGIGDQPIDEGMELTIYVDPKPPERKADVQLPEFTVRPDAISVGSPQQGRIANAIQFPSNDNLYKRRNPQIMWCSSYVAENLQRAIAWFRHTYAFEGEIVIADMSRKAGGHFPPHKSHQAGRDVDIWLPTIRGVYQPSHLHPGRERRPTPEEADWFALYGLLEALHETESVEVVYLADELHERVYKAAKLMGASDQDLDEIIAPPHGKARSQALLQHSAGHTHHIHVRFKCGPNDECPKTVDNSPDD